MQRKATLRNNDEDSDARDSAHVFPHPEMKSQVNHRLNEDERELCNMIVGIGKNLWILIRHNARRPKALWRTIEWLQLAHLTI